MARTPIWLSLILLSCGEDSTSPEALGGMGGMGGMACATVDYSVCGGPLPATQYDGQPWPTFSEALAAELNCFDGRGAEDPWAPHVRGVCADGKQFISRNGGYIGNTLYFDGESLVGRTSYTDIAFGPCACETSSFAGTLETVRCDAPTVEALCDSELPESLEVPFAQGTTYCSCDDL